MARQSGALDRRLLVWPVPVEVLDDVLTDHPCDGEACSGCGQALVGRGAVCRSAVVARAARTGRRPAWPVLSQRRGPVVDDVDVTATECLFELDDAVGGA